MREKSTSTAWSTCALVAFERTMCSAVIRRMRENGTKFWPPSAAGVAAGASARAAGPREGPPAAAAGAPPAAAGAAGAARPAAGSPTARARVRPRRDRAGRGGTRLARGDEVDHVAAGDAAVSAAAADRREIKPILGGGSADGGGEALGAGAGDGGAGVGALRGWRRGGRCRGGGRVGGSRLDSRSYGGRSCGGRSCGGGVGFAFGGDDGEDGTDLDRLTGRDEDLLQHPFARRRNLHRDFVGLDVREDLVHLDVVADLLVPHGNRALGDRLAELRHQYVHVVVLRTAASRRAPAPSRRCARG